MRLALVLILLAASIRSIAAAEAIAIAAEFRGGDGILVEVRSVLPENSCVRIVASFEGEMAPATQVAEYLKADGSVSVSLGPYPGRAFLRGEYRVFADVDPRNQDPRVQPFFQENSQAIHAETTVRIGTPTEAEEDRKATAEHLARLVAECREWTRRIQTAHQDLLAGRRFVRADGRKDALDADAWAREVRQALEWEARTSGAQQDRLDGLIGPYYPDLTRYASFNLIGSIGLLAREVGAKGFERFRVKPPPEFVVDVPVKPDLDALSMMVERDARRILQGIGAAPLRPISEVVVSPAQVPAGLRLRAGRPTPLVDLAQENPCTLSVETIAALPRETPLCPPVDLAGVQQVFWMGLEPEAGGGALDIWIVAYDTPARAQAAAARLGEELKDSPGDFSFGGEQFLCWVHSQGKVGRAAFGEVLGLCHKRLGW